ncbi:MAG: iron ABC transporter permease [Clostridiales bacterium]|nr:iron ABC transporter permease [Candidatus Apopatocola equi]
MIQKAKERTVLTVLLLSVICMSFVCLMIGSSHMTVRECIAALRGTGSASQIRILRSIRLPRVLAALIAGAGLSVSGLLMQTALDNPMASPSTLGVSNAAVFGANLSIIAFAGGYLSTGHNVQNYATGASPYATSLLAFAFAALSILLILGLCRLKSFSPSVVVLSGIAMGSVWTAATTLLQFYATDVGLSAAVIWSFGDLGRATYKTDAIMLAVTGLGLLVFTRLRWQCNALLSGDATARSMGVSVDRLRFLCLLLSSLITAVIVSFLGIIGFVGIICPHLVKKLLGEDHRITLPLSALSGSLLLLLSDTLSRSMGNGSALPVGAVTSLLGAPFFVGILLGRKGE